MPNQVMTVRIVTKGKSPLAWIQDVDKRIHFEMQSKLVDSAKATAELMKKIIKSSIKRDGSTGKLENSINVELLNTEAGVHIGIGRITNLPPYWQVIDEGGYIPPANLGYFGNTEAPQAGKSGEKWTHTGDRTDFLMIPKKLIEPIRYVEISETELRQHIAKQIRQLMPLIKQES